MAHALRMWHTTYTDPSGFDPGTRSTAADQVVLAKAAMGVAAFAQIVALKSYPVPVVGVVRSTDALLGTDGFVGIKTGSMDASGGCFMFASHRVLDGHPVMLYGVVLGQPGHNLITAALTAARELADQLAPQPV
jgi:D-alanyl-D-alanine carboxypeptidase (penicillin-binding protein 5/6)